MATRDPVHGTLTRVPPRTREQAHDVKTEVEERGLSRGGVEIDAEIVDMG
jgi:hypothetical protein